MGKEFKGLGGKVPLLVVDWQATHCLMWSAICDNMCGHQNSDEMRSEVLKMPP